MKMNRTAEAYDRVCGAWAAFRKTCRVNACVAELAGRLRPGARVLDVGCGTGYPIAAYLCGAGFKVVGIDVSEAMLAQARALDLPGAAFERVDLLDYRAKEEFDAVIAFDALWHIEHERQREIYGIVSSLLKPGGYFLFTHGRADGEIVGEMFGRTFYYSALAGETVKALLAENGFEILSWRENYKEETTGERDLLAVAKKRSA